MAIISQTLSPQSTPDIVLQNINCDASVSIGDWVRMTSGGIAVKALADNKDNSNIIGLVEDKTSSTTCIIRVAGVSKEIFTSLDVTKEYYLSSTVAGGMIKQGDPLPSLSGNIVLKVGQPFSSTRFLVLKGIRFERS